MNSWLIGAPALSLAAVAGAAVYSAVYPRSQIFGKTTCRTNSPRKLAITFDDGPNPAITPQLLELLERYKARATFFVVGKFVRECPELLLETASRGHVIGNHTDAHPNLSLLGPDGIAVELRCCNSSIGEATGASPKWFRPPYGMRNPWVIPNARELGMSTVMWTRIPGDWNAKSTDWLIPRMDCIAEHARENIDIDPAVHGVGTGDILCLHDGDHAKLNGDRRHTLAALEHWMPRWRDLGLEFVTIDEAVSTPAL
jgi:peptidoglycan-N-acetylglucosamine deacetylase